LVDTQNEGIFSSGVHMSRRRRRKFTDEFKAETVKLIPKSGKTVAEVARELDLTESSVRNWVKQAEIDSGGGPPGALTTEEREERQPGGRGSPRRADPSALARLLGRAPVLVGGVGWACQP
jgi:transposase